MYNIKSHLKKACPFTHVYDDKGPDGRPASEIGYIRADFDGYRWWSSSWAVHPDLETPQILREFDAVCKAFFEAFPSLEALKEYCEKKTAQTPDPTEFNAYLNLEYGYYWLRMITREKDYNLYLRCYKRNHVVTSEI